MAEHPDSNTSQQPPSPVPTEVAVATWKFWPEAPLNDFARLIPDNPQARRAFRQVVQGAVRADPAQPLLPSYSQPYIHWECAGDDAIPESDTDPASDESLYVSRADPGSSSAPDLPNVTGFYRFNLVQPTPRNRKLGWIVGLGGRKGVDVEFIVAPKGYPKVHSRHLRILLSQSNVLLAVSDSYEFYVDGFRLRRRVLDQTDPDINVVPQPKKKYQRALLDGSRLILGDLEYILRTCPENRANVAMGVLADVDVDALLTPTPQVLDNYALWQPFTRGSFSTVLYATYLFTGAKVVIKRVTTPNVSKLQDFIDPAPFSRRDLRESYLVIVPAAKDCLDRAVRDLPSLLPPEVDSDEFRPVFAARFLGQMADACAYLYEQGIIHRDLKPANVALQPVDSSISPQSRHSMLGSPGLA